MEKKLTACNSELGPESFNLPVLIVVVVLCIPAEGEGAEIFTGISPEGDSPSCRGCSVPSCHGLSTGNKHWAPLSQFPLLHFTWFSPFQAHWIDSQRCGTPWPGEFSCRPGSKGHLSSSGESGTPPCHGARAEGVCHGPAGSWGIACASTEASRSVQKDLRLSTTKRRSTSKNTSDTIHRM